MKSYLLSAVLLGGLAMLAIGCEECDVCNLGGSRTGTTTTSYVSGDGGCRDIDCPSGACTVGTTDACGRGCPVVHTTSTGVSHCSCGPSQGTVQYQQPANSSNNFNNRNNSTGSIYNNNGR